MSDISQIDGSAIRLKRESQGWAIADLASRACLSVKQIRQIEEGGMTAFYSESVKLTAARKVAGLLHMSEIQLFGQQPAAVEPVQEDETLLHDSVHVASPSLTAQAAVASVAANPIMRSEALHVLAQPPEHVEAEAADTPEEAADAAEAAIAEAVAQTATQTAIQSGATTADNTASAADAQPAGSGYFLKIMALFLVALAAAALLRPKVLEDKPEASATETPAPPVLTPTVGTPAGPEAAPNSEAPAANKASAAGTATPLTPANSTAATDLPSSAVAPAAAKPPAAAPVATPTATAPASGQ